MGPSRSPRSRGRGVERKKSASSGGRLGRPRSWVRAGVPRDCRRKADRRRAIRRSMIQASASASMYSKLPIDCSRSRFCAFLGVIDRQEGPPWLRRVRIDRDVRGDDVPPGDPPGREPRVDGPPTATTRPRASGPGRSEVSRPWPAGTRFDGPPPENPSRTWASTKNGTTASSSSSRTRSVGARGTPSPIPPPGIIVQERQRDARPRGSPAQTSRPRRPGGKRFVLLRSPTETRARRTPSLEARDQAVERKRRPLLERANEARRGRTSAIVRAGPARQASAEPAGHEARRRSSRRPPPLPRRRCGPRSSQPSGLQGVPLGGLGFGSGEGSRPCGRGRGGATGQRGTAKQET